MVKRIGHKPPSDPPPGDLSAAEPAAEGGGTTVYLIDDDRSVRRSLRRLLRSAGYEVEEFSSAGEFLERKLPTGAGCLVLDVRMPGMTGTELFDRLVRSGSSLPVVFLTGHGEVATSVHAMKEGAVDFLLKPVDSDTFLRTIREAVERHAAVRAIERKRAEVHARLSRLSPREREVMEQVVRGLPNRIIATSLGITEKTVKVHRHRVMKKAGVRSVAELVRLADADATSQGGSERPGDQDLPRE